MAKDIENPLYFCLPTEQRTLPELWSHQGRHQKMEAHEAPRKDGRRATCDSASEKPAKKEHLNLCDYRF